MESENIKSEINSTDDDEVESLFTKKFVSNLDGNRADAAARLIEQDNNDNMDFDDTEFDRKINRFNPNNNDPDDVLILSTPNLKQRKFQKQNLSKNSEYRSDDNNDESITVSNVRSLSSSSSDKHKDEIEDAKRYFEIYSTPSYRWSMDMIPNNLINISNKNQSVGESPKSLLIKQIDTTTTNKNVRI
ncbi:uncharacterized protein LOC142645585 [Dermatophagoides pteronyssinus]|uniref:uncharacterized protein LOC142645585 n=1 Tax=Dermatophagoides pteronyssinus TaxID=6956 RepID=UPI003F67105F